MLLIPGMWNLSLYHYMGKNIQKPLVLRVCMTMYTDNNLHSVTEHSTNTTLEEPEQNSNIRPNNNLYRTMFFVKSKGESAANRACATKQVATQL